MTDHGWPRDGFRRAVSWHCDPPPRGELFTVTRESWAFRDGLEIREILEVRRLPADLREEAHG